MYLIKPKLLYPISGLAGFGGGPSGVVLDYGKGPPVPPRKWTVDPSETNTNNETQTYTAPSAGTYTFYLFGAGGNPRHSDIGTSNSAPRGGWSAPVKAQIPLLAGNTIELGIGMKDKVSESAGSEDSMKNYANSSNYHMRGGNGSHNTEGGSGGGGSYIRATNFTPTAYFHSTYKFMVAAGGGGGAGGHTYSYQQGGYAPAGAGGSYDSGWGNYSATNDRFPTMGTQSGLMKGGDANSSDGQGVGGGGGGAGAGSNGTSCTNGHNGNKRGYVTAVAGTLVGSSTGGVGGGAHSGCASGGGGGGGSVSFTAYSSGTSHSGGDVFAWNGDVDHRGYCRNNYDTSTSLGSHTHWVNAISKIVNAGLTYDWEGAGTGSDSSGNASFVRRHGAIFLTEVN